MDGSLSVLGEAGEVFTINRTLTDGLSENGVVFVFAASDTGSVTTGQTGLSLINAASGEALDSMIRLSNNDTDDAVGAAITLETSGGGFTEVIDNQGTLISSAELNLLDGGILLSELTDSGTLTAGTVDINGGAIDGTTGSFTTLASTGVTTLGDNSATVAVNSSDWDISATGDVSGIGSIGMDGNFAQTGATTFSTGTGSVDLNGAVTVISTLNVAGLSSLDGGIDADGVFTVADVSGDVHTSGTLDVDSTSNFDDDVTLTGATTDLSVGGNATISGNAVFSTRVNLGSQTFVVTDDGTANDTLTPTASYVKVTQDAGADAGTPDVVIGEGSATDGDVVIIVRTDANAGDVTISDTAGVTEIGAAETFGAGEFDTLILLYAGDRWVQIGGSQN